MSAFVGLGRDDWTKILEHGATPRHMLPVVAAVRDYRLALVQIGDDTSVKVPKDIERRPILVIVGDDTDQSRGPAAFHEKSLRRFIRECKNVVLHCAEALPEHYAYAARSAVTERRCLVIESRPAHEVEWMAFVRQANPTAHVLLITPNVARYSSEVGTA